MSHCITSLNSAWMPLPLVLKALITLLRGLLMMIGDLLLMTCFWCGRLLAMVDQRVMRMMIYDIIGSWNQTVLPDSKIWSLPFLGLRPHTLHPGTIKGKEGIKFCYLATLFDFRIKYRHISSSWWFLVQPCQAIFHTKSVSSARGLQSSSRAPSARLSMPSTPRGEASRQS